MSIEIERKFLLQIQPQELIEQGVLQFISEHRIEQTYLALAEDQELRVRKLTDLASGEVSYTHTFKKGFGLKREEIEYSISAGLYEQIINKHAAVPLTKNRITAKWGDKIVEIDVYDQISLTVLEVEFASEEEARNWKAPDWIGADISTEKKYSNKKVWAELQAGK